MHCWLGTVGLNACSCLSFDWFGKYWDLEGMVSHCSWWLHVGSFNSILPLLSCRLTAVLLLSADLEGKDRVWPVVWFYLWPMALMGSFVAVVTIRWLIVGCRYEIAWLIVDAREAVAHFWGYFLVFCCHKWHRLIALCKNSVRFFVIKCLQTTKKRDEACIVIYNGMVIVGRCA